MGLTPEEKRRFLRALEEDEEFRLAVAGAVGLGEVLKELRNLRRDSERRWRRWYKTWQKFLEENEKRWQENERRWLENERRWQEWYETWRKFLEENEKRRQENERRWRENEERWERAFREFKWIRSAMEQLQEALGVSLEFYTAQWIREWLSAKGYRCRPTVHASLLIDGVKEVDVFCPDPPVVAEVKAAVPTVKAAEEALAQLKTAVEAAERFLKKRIYAAVLAVESAPEEVAEHLRRRAEEAGYILILGRGH
ncbi:hypothetical protein TUZN_0114 [Thermoproteus uzoniensis 768-20]|uniref:PaREP7 n=1 Tax=Thermoproteus uzoniensis (strain 768-20) TaxID=999630 RepID=F2L1E7_THEU7|nr:hypothetical protein [Thermoproteus uzoniensis]AEA11617.1 hypothetical protein TUZN_0114 [Thermoproteus uzoniensis 768-20]